MRYMNTVVVLAFGLVLGGCLHDEDEEPGQSTPPPEANDPVVVSSAMFVLGDSLSDVGNAAGAVDFLLSLSISPPTVGFCNPVDVLVLPRPCDDLFFGKSRVSDGPVAVEYLAVHFGLAELMPSLHVLPDGPVTGTVYAVASATAREQGQADLPNQVDMLLLDHALGLPADALYVVIIGGNDAIDALPAALAGTPEGAQLSAGDYHRGRHRDRHPHRAPARCRRTSPGGRQRTGSGDPAGRAC